MCNLRCVTLVHGLFLEAGVMYPSASGGKIIHTHFGYGKKKKRKKLHQFAEIDQTSL